MRRSPKLALLILAHLLVALLSPGIGGLVFLCLQLGADSFLHLGGPFALGFGVLFSYVFYIVPSFLFVVIASPLLWWLSRARSMALAFAAAPVMGGMLGWVLGRILTVGEERAVISNASLAAGLTGICAAVVLELTWRYVPGIASANENVTPENR
jgi:hypothetical protein